ncbi:MAG: hypothetical protein ACNYVW_08305 [Methanosarcinales archaeon]
MKKLIEIKINGSRKRELLAIIRNQFDHINSTIKKVAVAQEIPCNCSSNCPYKFNYEKLLMAEERGKKTVDCQESWEEVQVSALLEGFVKKEERMKETDDVFKEKREELIRINHVHANEVTIMRDNIDQINVEKGMVISRSPGVHDINFNQLWNEIKDKIDLSALTKELVELRSKLKDEATEPEHDMSIGAIASAERSAKEGNGPKALEYLSKAGRWTLDKATKISVPVATAALKAALGL